LYAENTKINNKNQAIKMKNLVVRILAIALVLLVANACDENLVKEENVPDESLLKSATVDKVSYIVVLNDEELNSELHKLKEYEKKQEKVKTVSEKILKRAGIIDRELGFVYGTALIGFSVKIPPGQLKKLQEDPSVKYVEQNQVISLIQPESIIVNGDISAQAQTVPWGVARVNGGADGTGKTAWVIDTGTDLDHPDLIVDSGRDYDFVNSDDNADDDNGHGTHCAGIIGAKDDGNGVIGVAAGATIVPVKVLDASGSGTVDGVIAGVDYVATYASSGDVANMSLGGGISTALDDAVLEASASCKFALAAGNERSNASLHSPARVNGSNIYTIAAFAEGDIWASYSNYGMPPVDYCEPGSYIYSTYKNGLYATMSGTSMATPHMTGILLVGNFVTDGSIIRKSFDDPYPVAVVGDEGGSTNTSPVAEINGPYSGNEDSPVSFSANGSSDDDGDALSYIWNFGDGTTANDQNPSHTYLWGGDFTVTLTVSDGNGGSNSKTTTATISEVNDLPIADAGGPYTGVTGLTITFDASNSSDYDNLDGTTANDQVLSYSWDFGDKTTSSLQNPTHSYSTAGTYTVTLTITDADGASDETTTTATISEPSPSVAPTFTSWNVANTSNPATKRVHITWSVEDSNGDLATVISTLKDPIGKTVSTTTTVSGSTASGVHDLSFKKGTTGAYTVTTIVTDGDGKSETKTGTIDL